jgi:hypothetical protein
MLCALRALFNNANQLPAASAVSHDRFKLSVIQT